MKTITVSLADIEGVPHGSSAAYTNVKVTAVYTGPVVLADGRVIPRAVKGKQLPNTGAVEFEVFASDDPDVAAESQGFAVRFEARVSNVRGEKGTTYTRTVKVLSSHASPVALGTLAPAEGLPREWVSVADMQAALDAQTAAAQQAAAAAQQSAADADQAASDAADAVTLAQQAQAAALEVPDNNVSALVSNPATDTYKAVVEEIEHRRIAPSLTPYTERAEPFRRVMIHEPDGTVHAIYSRTGSTYSWQISDDHGYTWTNRSNLPAQAMAAVKLSSGTILAVQQASTYTTGGSNPNIYRSTDNGATWTTVSGALKFPPLSQQGISEGPDGSILIGEYGNVGNHAYRIMRSTNDGVSWTEVNSSSGSDPQGDPGHWHSVTYDAIEGKHVAFSDRPISPMNQTGPEIHASADNGVTWELLGMAYNVERPNFVSPMYFQNYIAWGSDNQVNGRISRIRRADFYAGNFGNVETVALLSRKALYFTFPLRPDVWAVTMATEHIQGGLQPEGAGTFTNEVWLVSNDGSVVSGGIDVVPAYQPLGVLAGIKSTLPSHRYDTWDHNGFLWANMPTEAAAAYSAVPASQGWEPTTKRVQMRAMPHMPVDTALTIARASDESRGTALRFIERLSTNNYVTVGNTAASSSSRAEWRHYDDGTLRLMWGSTILLSVSSGGVLYPEIRMTSSGQGLRVGGTEPNGNVTAPSGTLYLNWNGGPGQTLWVKESGAGNTGWTPFGMQLTRGGTASRPANPIEGTPYYDWTIKRPIWWNGTAWIDATGAVV